MDEVIFWGLRVRMCIATGICEGKKVSIITARCMTAIPTTNSECTALANLQMSGHAALRMLLKPSRCRLRPWPCMMELRQGHVSAQV